MDYFGFTIWTDIIYANESWLKSLDLGVPNEFDPEDNLWPKIFNRLYSVMEKSKLNGKLGATLHISSDIARFTSDIDMFDIKPQYFQGRNEFTKSIPFDLGIHSQFSPTLNPLGNIYNTAFREDVERAIALESNNIVSHPPYNPSYNHIEILEMIIDDVCTPEHLEILKFTNINHSWENMIEGQFSSLEELLILVNGLKDRMKELGFLDVANRQFICLDTGHLNIWRNKHFSKIKADQEIERFMPEIGALLKVYHIHANDGRSDNHISLFSRLFEEHPSRKGINWEEFEASSKRIQEWITVCDSYKKVDGRHIHLEVDKVPFSLEQIIDFGKWYSTII